ncbi:hypothetical protein KIPB_010841 [Kipferlia bialata]|uniref:Uncharacterized protein n=1 Tax=Kipferlia bialata TaxID=797122 RepID=A0A391NYV9_9EUKA|nr:hypothetical protein KIPB_010841 [Kipferlia bialata]|eukprot:g10841.t1
MSVTISAKGGYHLVSFKKATITRDGTKVKIVCNEHSSYCSADRLVQERLWAQGEKAGLDAIPIRHLIGVPVAALGALHLTTISRLSPTETLCLDLDGHGLVEVTEGTSLDATVTHIPYPAGKVQS